MCAHMYVSVHVNGGGTHAHVRAHSRTHARTPVLTGGCGKEVVPELGSACLWLRERGIKSSQQLSP